MNRQHTDNIRTALHEAASKEEELCKLGNKIYHELDDNMEYETYLKRFMSLINKDLFCNKKTLDFIRFVWYRMRDYTFFEPIRDSKLQLVDMNTLEVIAYLLTVKTYKVDGKNFFQIWKDEYPELFEEAGRCFDFFLSHIGQNKFLFPGYAFLPVYIHTLEKRLTYWQWTTDKNNKRVKENIHYTLKCQTHAYNISQKKCKATKITKDLIITTMSTYQENSLREKRAQDLFKLIQTRKRNPRPFEKPICVLEKCGMSLPSLADSPSRTLVTQIKKKRKAARTAIATADGLNNVSTSHEKELQRLRDLRLITTR